MFLFVPVRTDSPVFRPPVVNRLLLSANVGVFLALQVLGAGLQPDGPTVSDEQTLLPYMLRPRHLELFQFFTYQFLHADLMHLLGNMLFLWVFGNSVNSKMGNVAYLFFYLACGVFAGIGFAMDGRHPCLGASGAIAGITTAYLVLYPRSAVTVFYWIWFYIGTTHIQAMTLIILKVILWDNIVAPSLWRGEDFVQVAYSAHIAGYAFGFVTCFLLLLVRALPRDQYDVVALLRRYQQREEFRRAMADPNARARAMYGRVARPVSPITGEVMDGPEAVPDDNVVRLREEIARLLAERNYDLAAERYQELVGLDRRQVLPRRQMLDVANQLMSTQRYPQAAAAYEKFVEAYPTDSDAAQVKLVLGIIYAKYLHQYETAQRYLLECLQRLVSADQQQQARQWLDVVTAALRQGPSSGPLEPRRAPNG